MKKIISAVLILMCIACTKVDDSAKSITPVRTDSASSESAPQKIEILQEDRQCKIDSDCDAVAVQCSCHCGDGVNKAHAAKYAELSRKLCENYTAIMCKMKCDGAIKCVNHLCGYSKG